MRLLVTDLDGTLLNRECKISKENREALQYTFSQGIEVVIATGRTYEDVYSLCKAAKISPYIISNNGACIYSKDGNRIKAESIDKEKAIDILNYLHENGFYYEIGTDKELFVPKNWETILNEEFRNLQKSHKSIDISYLSNTKKTIFSQKGIVLINNYVDFLNRDVGCYSISVISFDKNKLSSGRKYIDNSYDLTVVSSSWNNFEIMNKVSTKGNSLEYLANHLNIPLSEVMAIGDNYNDETMLEKAGISVAMENAEEHIKNICKHITKANEFDGVAKAIYKFIA